MTDATPNAPSGKINSFFEISKHGSTLGRGVRGGSVTFPMMAYILVSNPITLSHALPKGGPTAMPDIAAETALIAEITTILMGVVVNYPMALTVGLGLDTMMALTLMLDSGLSL